MEEVPVPAASPDADVKVPVPGSVPGSVVPSSVPVLAFTLFAMAEGIVHRQVFEGSEHSKADVIEMGSAMLAAFFDSYLAGSSE